MSSDLQTNLTSLKTSGRVWRHFYEGDDDSEVGEISSRTVFPHQKLIVATQLHSIPSSHTAYHSRHFRMTRTTQQRYTAQHNPPTLSLQATRSLVLHLDPSCSTTPCPSTKPHTTPSPTPSSSTPASHSLPLSSSSCYPRANSADPRHTPMHSCGSTPSFSPPPS